MERIKLGKVISLIVALCMVLPMAVPLFSYAAEQGYTLTVNGENVPLTVEPYTNDRGLMVSAKDVAGAYNLQYKFDSVNKSFTVKDGGDIVFMHNATEYSFKGDVFSCPEIFYVENGEPMIELSFFVDLFGASYFEVDGKKIIIKTVSSGIKLMSVRSTQYVSGRIYYSSGAPSTGINAKIILQPINAIDGEMVAGDTVTLGSVLIAEKNAYKDFYFDISSVVGGCDYYAIFFAEENIKEYGYINENDKVVLLNSSPLYTSKVYEDAKLFSASSASDVEITLTKKATLSGVLSLAGDVVLPEGGLDVSLKLQTKTSLRDYAYGDPYYAVGPTYDLGTVKIPQNATSKEFSFVTSPYYDAAYPAYAYYTLYVVADSEAVSANGYYNKSESITESEISTAVYKEDAAELTINYDSAAYINIQADPSYVPTGGVCGDSLIWKFDESTGTLKISGSGAMKDYTQSGAPWTAWNEEITTIDVSSGAASIGDYAFANCSAATEVKIAKTVTEIGANAFSGCSQLAKVSYGGNEESYKKINVESGNDALSSATVSYAEIGGLIQTVTISSSTGGLVFAGERPNLGKEEVENGTILSLIAKPEENSQFRYWIDAYTNKIISEESEVSLNVYADRNVIAVFADGSDENEFFVAFRGINNIPKRDMVARGESAVAPSESKMYSTGYAFAGWDKDFSNIQEHTEVKALYEAKNVVVTVTVKGGKLAGDKTSRTFEYDEIVYVFGDDPPEGKVFAGWMVDGKIVSYSSYYQFYATNDVYIEAVYADSVEEKVAITMTVTEDKSGEYDIAGFLVERYVPYEWTMAETGVIYVKTRADSDDLVLEKVGQKIGAKTIKRSICSNTDPYGKYKLNSSYGTDGVTAVGYVVYFDGSGQKKVAYTEEYYVGPPLTNPGGIEEDLDLTE